MKRNAPPLLAAVLALSGLAACEATEDCTDIAIASVQLTLVDASTGEAIEDATATYVAGDRSGECETWDPGVWTCGYEIEGTFEITATAEGYAPRTGTVTVGGGRCHVRSESLEIALSPEA